MKTWNIDAKLLSNDTAVKAIDASRPLLERVLGRSRDNVNVNWSLGSDPRNPHSLILSLSDWTWPSGVQVALSVNDLQSEPAARWKFLTAWGDLLQARNHEELRQLQELVGA